MAVSIWEKMYFGYEIDRWLTSVKIRCKASTYSTYVLTVNKRIVPVFSSVKTSRITEEMVNDFTNELLKTSLAPKTIKDTLVMLKGIFKSADLKININFPKIPKKEMRILTKEEQKRLEEYIFNNPNRITLSIAMSLYMGLRLGEVCALQCNNIDLNNKKVVIRQTITRIKNSNSDDIKRTVVVIAEPKTLSSIREIPIPLFLIPLLRKFVDESSNYFVSGKEKYMESRTFYKKYKIVLKELDMGSYTFHTLRHTFASRCIEFGSDAKTLSEVLGHSNVKITLDRYVHPSYENKKALINNVKRFYSK